jgi:nucleoside-diphosphate-sugar epimerase
VPGPLRPRRTGAPARPAVVAVTGAGSGAGAAVLAHLAASPRLTRVVGVDATVALGLQQAPGGPDLSWYEVDMADPRITGAFAGVTAVVHLAVDLAPDADRAGQRRRNTRAAQTVITAAFAAGVRRVVVVSSALAYGAYADNPVPLGDDAPLRAVPEASVVGDLLEIERIAAASRRSHRGLTVTVLRPAVVLGAGDREPMAALLSAPRLLRIRGAATRWQFCHVADLAAAVELAALAPPGKLDGPANVACAGWLDHDELERVSGRRSLELPERVAVGTAERLHRLGLTPAPPSELAYLVHPWVVDCARLRTAGWTPRYGNEEAVAEHVREVGRGGWRDARGATAAAGAAGAAVALVGTAALVRRARRRRSG